MTGTAWRGQAAQAALPLPLRSLWHNKEEA